MSNKLFLAINPQAKILLVIIVVGFMLTCLLSFLAINALKYEYDSNLNIHVKEIQALGHIQSFYSIDKLQTPKEETIKMGLDSLRQAMQKNDSKNVFFALHTLYQKIFMPKAYKKLRDLYSEENKALNLFYAQIQESQPDNPHPSNLSKSKTVKNPVPMNKVPVEVWMDKIQKSKALISSIIQLRLEITAIQNSTIDSIYTATCMILFLFIMVILLTTVLLAQNILSSISSQEEQLKLTIEEKTLELESINKNLKKTVQTEVEASRKKDHIMHQQDRLASMGEMIQNIAHQWRQPLNSLIIIIQSFRIKFHNKKLDAKFIESQTEYGLRIAENMSETIENFRHFFQPNKLKEGFSIKDSIKDSIKLIDFIFKQNNIRVITHFECDVKFYGYKNSFSQVILNLLKNSQDAIIERGIKNGVCKVTLKKEHDRILISLKDNAGGIKEQRIDKIFEPYFTTKHKSVGTGIGLFMCKEIIEKQMQGSIQCTNQKWSINSKNYFGASFIIDLPNTKK